MKTAISVPNDVYEGAERLARRTGRSRSELYSSAMAEYLASHDPDRVTESIDRVLATLDQTAEDFPSTAASRTLIDVEW